MLEAVLQHLRNWFQVSIRENTYTIEDGSIALPFLAQDQYFRVCGSVFNDGLHKYPANDLKDETFRGTVWALAIPADVVEISEEIKTWAEKNGTSPYVSESFGGYTYTKATNGKGGVASWEATFAPRLNAWRKAREL